MKVLSSIKRRYLNATGKIKEKWPIKVRVYRENGGDFILSKETRGRSLKEENGEIKLEIMDTDLQAREVPYKYFTNRRDGSDELEVVRHTRTSFSPLNKEIKESGEDDYEVEKIYDMEEMKRNLLDDFKSKTDVVETDDTKWYKNEKIQAVILFMGAGIFFVLLGIGYSRVISQPILDKLNNLEAASSIIPVVGLFGKQKIRDVKKQLER